ncbi:MAG: hypothetical protein NTW31_00455 [Bacteroidetes bacterium]|nr:hypothetical protein [Bacteroidota bacterium]
MISDCKEEIKNWAVYFLSAMAAVFIHEIGHCIPAWLQGYAAIPTPAMEYILHPVTAEQNQWISLGGYIGTVLFIMIVLIIFLFTDFKYNSALYAGAVAISGMYCALFFINGRGHGGHEFQEAQAALGFSYSGHSLDVFFLTIFTFLTAVWFINTRPGYKIIPKLLTGVVVTFFFFIALEWINNSIFDPLFKAGAFPRN